MKRFIIAAVAVAAVAPAAFAAGETARLVTALPDGAWLESVWLSAPGSEPTREKIYDDNGRAADGASWFTTTFTNDKSVSQARWMTTGLGTYDLWVNSQPVGDEVLRPGFTHYARTRRSFTYDVTDLIDTAKGASNTLTAEVTPGWWADKIITPYGHEGMLGRRPAFRSVLELTYDDGTTALIGTNTADWKAMTGGPVTHAAIFDGEEYDARIPAGYLSAAGYDTPLVNDEFHGEILPTDGAEIYHRHDLAMAPVKAYAWKGVTGDSEDAYGTVNVTREFTPGSELLLVPGETIVLDFGQNAAAVPAFRFNGARDTRLTCLPGELLNDGNGARSRGMDGPEGSVHRLNLRIPDIGMRLVYTFAGDPVAETYIPRHTFYGYRFLSLTATDTVRIAEILSVPVSSITPAMECGTIVTGNDLVNQLISNTVWGQRSNYLSVTTDCPQRNERLGWTADTQVFAETGSFFADTRRFMHKWMRDMRDTQSPRGGFPGVAPWGQYGSGEREMMRVGWADAGVIVPWVMLKQYGDTALVNECWESMLRYMNHVNDTRYDHLTLKDENGDYQWADWLSYEPLESCGGGIYVKDADGRDVISPQAIDYWNYLSANYWLMDARMMADMARATGRDAAMFESMAAAASDYIRSTFMDADGNFNNPVLNTMQTPALFALHNGLVEGGARDEMVKRLRDNFAAHGNCLQTGFLGTSILMSTLTDNGMVDIAYDLLFQRRNPSWLYSVDNGATTVWERWNSYTLDGGMGPRGMNSFNHYAYGCVCEWLWKTAAGISADINDPAFRHIIMAPRPDKRLGSIDATYRSPAGLIKSSWTYDGNNFIWDFTIPEGSTVSVYLPGDTTPVDYPSGSHHIEPPSIKD